MKKKSTKVKEATPEEVNSPASKLKEILKRKKARAALIVIFILLAGVILDTTEHSALSANFADSVLRPLLGNERTLALESFFFNGTDLFNQLTYKLVSPKDPFSGEKSAPLTQSVKISQMDLSPIRIQNFTNTILPGEGKWVPVRVNSFPLTIVLAKTFIRPDPERPYAIVSLVKINMRLLRLSAVAGTKEPGGGEGHPGPGKIPQNILDSNGLVGAFNGGFQEKDGHYGMVVGSQTYLPLLKGLATLVVDKNSDIRIVNYQGQDLGKDNLVIRQNGGMLLDNSIIIPSLGDSQYSIWGRTVTNSMYTWRSGIGITKDGDLLYAVGPSLVPQTLAQALLSAGAVNAMQLDINPYWVRFVVFNSLGNGKYEHYSLQKNMYDGALQFLHGYQKDFFYLYKR